MQQIRYYCLALDRRIESKRWTEPIRRREEEKSLMLKFVNYIYMYTPMGILSRLHSTKYKVTYQAGPQA